ncbi:MAG: TIGR03960 family B12-binding radical SAM protein [Oscillospiraceae bacterium]|nr:TIGR03960 family B12-binding radical SAM protein [Oscillospiraceae bacterium]
MNLKRKIEKVLLNVQKPARYIGGEHNSIVKDKNKVDLRFAFCFPDTYEIGMSHLGMKILYSILNDRENIWCERVFAPWFDMKEQMEKENIPLFALESLEPVSEFDIIGFTLQYELCYTNILYMLELAGIKPYAKDRKELKNLVVGGGPCVCNCEPIADFFDLFMLGDGEDVILELSDLYIKHKKMGSSKREFLLEAAKIKGIYVPQFYDVSYNDDGTVKEILPNVEEAPKTITKRVVEDFDKTPFPDKFVVPFIDTVHDRAVLEVLRGCIRGCRFCQAGFIYRPFREKNIDTLCNQAKQLYNSTGYDELSLCSLSTSDYSEIEKLLTEITEWSNKNKVSLSLPSLRVDNFSKEVLDKISGIRKSGLTFAPEAGTQRLRDVINKNVSDEEIHNTCKIAFEGGYTNVKLYFMIGLPTETDSDIEGIINTAQSVVDLFYSLPDKPKGKGVTVTISVATFVPKPHTPFQWEAQNSHETVIQKHELLKNTRRSKKITLNYHASNTSILEGALARGDRRHSKVIYETYKSGSIFDSWGEGFDFEKWQNAFLKAGLDIAFYQGRKREFTEVLPWSHIDYGVSQKFLEKEAKKAYLGQTTINCRQGCAGCGANRFKGGECHAKY